MSGGGAVAGTAQTAKYCAVDISTCIPTFTGAVANSIIDDVNKMIIESMTIQTSTKGSEVQDGSSGDLSQYGITEWRVKWRNNAEKTMVPVAPLVGSQTQTTNAATVLNATGANFWFNKWGAITTRKAGSATKDYLSGLSFQGCEVTSTAPANAGACATVKNATKALTGSMATLGADGGSTLTGEIKTATAL